MNRFRWLCFGLIFVLACRGESKPTSSTSTPSATTPESVIAEIPKEPVTITVAAAADLKFAFAEVSAEFQHVHPEVKVETTFGGSGSFYAQLENKAPFDLFLSADVGFPRKLIEHDAAEVDSEFLYAIGRVGVWVRNDSPLDLEKQGIEALSDASVRAISIANPEVAPYGRAAEAALRHFGIYTQIQDRLVRGENVAQAAQFVESGSADAGLIAHSLALAPAMKEKGRFWMIPADAHPRIEQGGVILKWAKNPEACQKLRSFLISQHGREILGRYGFEQPEK